MTSKIFYVVHDPNTATGLDIVGLREFMEKADMREIIKPGSEEECKAFMGQYSAENPYKLPEKVQQEKIEQARSFAGKMKQVPRPKEYPLIPNDALTPEERINIITQSCQEVGYLLHASLIYTNEKRTIDATVTMNTGEVYQLTFKKISDGEGK